MAVILSIETATPVCSVALHGNGKLLGLSELFVARSHSEQLAMMIKQLLKSCGVSLGELQAVAVSKGPGSYTGLRIGTATAKGLCYGLNIPLIAVNTLMGMAYQITEAIDGRYLCPMIDARRMEVYCLVADRKLTIMSETAAVVVKADTFDQWLHQGKLVIFGNGSNKCRPLFDGKNCQFLEDVHPTAKTIGILSTELFNKEAFEDLAYFEPFYLKDFRTTTPKDKAGFVN